LTRLNPSQATLRAQRKLRAKRPVLRDCGLEGVAPGCLRQRSTQSIRLPPTRSAASPTGVSGAGRRMLRPAGAPGSRTLRRSSREHRSPWRMDLGQEPRQRCAHSSFEELFEAQPIRWIERTRQQRVCALKPSKPSSSYAQFLRADRFCKAITDLARCPVRTLFLQATPRKSERQFQQSSF